MISKRLIFIWLGSEVPDYGKFCMDAFKQVNPNFEIMLVHEPDMKNIQNQDLKDCISLVDGENYNFYKHMVVRPWAKKHLFGEVGHITAISDAFRFYLLNKYGGIYLDLDTFPVKPFDDKLLSYENGFTVNYRPNRYDIFFVGMNKGCVDSGLVRLPNGKNEKCFDEKVHRILYYEKIWQRIYEAHCQDIKCKFFNCLLQIGECMYNSMLVPQYYVDHFRKNSWKQV